MLHAAYGSCFLVPITEILGYLAAIRLDSSYDVDEVAGNVARDVVDNG